MVEYDQMWFIFSLNCLPCGPHSSSIGVAALGFRWYRSSHPDPGKKSSTADLIFSPILLPSQVFFHVGGTENSQLVPNEENMGGDQPVQSHSHAQQPLQSQFVCRSIVLVKQDSLRQFSRPSPKCH